MGNYITSDILEQRIGSTRLSSLAGDSPSALLSAVIARAESTVDGYAATRYATPLASNDLIVEWTLCIAEYEIYKRGPGESVPTKIKDSFNSALSQLKSLAAGELQIPSAQCVKPSSASGISLSVSAGRTECFDGQSMEGF